MEITAEVRKRFSSLIIELPVQQAGSGDPSPENIRPIAQWTGIELYVADTDTATEPTETTTLPTPIFGGMVDVARGEVASLYNEKKSSSGWEMVEEGQFRCQVSAFNNGDETSTNVADLYSSHYKTVSNKDAYDATDDLTCGTATIEGVTYLYVNDLNYTTLEDFTAYIGDVQFVYKSHIPMSDMIEPTIVYLPEGTSYVWAKDDWGYTTLSLTAFASPMSIECSKKTHVTSCDVAFSPSQDLHGYTQPWLGGDGKNKFDSALFDTYVGVPIVYTTYNIDNGTYTMSSPDFPDVSGKSNVFVFAGEVTSGADSAINGVTSITSRTITVTDGKYTVGYRSFSSGNSYDPKDYKWQFESGSSASAWSPYSNVCPIYGWTGADIYIEPAYDPTATPKATVLFSSIVYGGIADVVNGICTDNAVHVTLDGSEDWIKRTGNNPYFALEIGDYGYAVGNKGLCSAYPRTVIAPSTTNIGFEIRNSSTYEKAYITIRPTNYSTLTLANFKTFLSNNPIEVVYELTTPTDFSFTPASNQLNLARGENYVWATMQDTNTTP